MSETKERFKLIEEAVAVLDGREFFENLVPKILDRQRSPQRRVEYLKMLHEWYVRRAESYTADLEFQVKVHRQLTECYETYRSLDSKLKGTRVDMHTQREDLMYNLGFVAGQTKSVEALLWSPQERKDKMRVNEALDRVGEYLKLLSANTGLKPFIRENIYYRCPNPKCGKVSQVKGEQDIRDQKACPFCLALLGDKDIVAPDKSKEDYIEVYPSTKPLGMLGPNATCYCTHCAKDVEGSPAAPCVQQTCPTCGNQLATRLKIGNEDPNKKYDYGNFDRSKGLKP